MSIASTAQINPTAQVAGDAEVGHFAVIGADVEIGGGAVIGHHVVIHDGSRVGASVRVDDHAVIGKRPMRSLRSATTSAAEIGPAVVGEGDIGALVHGKPPIVGTRHPFAK